mmetsp:Transcript_31569/g.84333  ORF Transcript_31569/g.84333 Transcript_31569/m.84333 type:complete len:244 (+) Transcript_31569:723-1454(+)
MMFWKLPSLPQMSLKGNRSTLFTSTSNAQSLPSAARQEGCLSTGTLWNPPSPCICCIPEMHSINNSLLVESFHTTVLLTMKAFHWGDCNWGSTTHFPFSSFFDRIPPPTPCKSSVVIPSGNSSAVGIFSRSKCAVVPTGLPPATSYIAQVIFCSSGSSWREPTSLAFARRTHEKSRSPMAFRLRACANRTGYSSAFASFTHLVTTTLPATLWRSMPPEPPFTTVLSWNKFQSTPCGMRICSAV